MAEETPPTKKRPWLLNQITPSFRRGGQGKLFRNVALGLTATFGMACVPGVAAAFTAASGATAWGQAGGAVLSQAGAWAGTWWNGVAVPSWELLSGADWGQVASGIGEAAGGFTPD